MSSANAPQGSADRAEELNRICGLPDLEFGREFALREMVYRVSSELAEDDEAWMSQLEAERDRRCAEREAQEAELERLRRSEDQLLTELREIVGVANDDDGPDWEEFGRGDALEASKAQAVELERLRETLLPFVLYFEHAFDQARKPSLNLPDPVGDGLVVTQAEVARARDLLSKPQPQEAREGQEDTNG